MLVGISGFDGYFISDCGVVYSAFQPTRQGWFIDYNKPLRKIKPKQTSTSTYMYVDLRKNKKSYRKSVHSLVCEHFIGPKPSDNHQCSHKDGNKYNNSYQNLVWETVIENIQRKHAHGTISYGINHPKSKLTQADLDVIRVWLDWKIPQYVIAESFSVSKITIHRIKTGKRYAAI